MYLLLLQLIGQLDEVYIDGDDSDETSVTVNKRPIEPNRLSQFQPAQISISLTTRCFSSLPCGCQPKSIRTGEEVDRSPTRNGLSSHVELVLRNLIPIGGQAWRAWTKSSISHASSQSLLLFAGHTIDEFAGQKHIQKLVEVCDSHHAFRSI